MMNIDRNRKNRLTMLEIQVPFPTPLSILHMIRNMAFLLCSCKINRII